jgi:chromosome segregation ATPase
MNEVDRRLDRIAQIQLELANETRRFVADIATAAKRLERRFQELEQHAAEVAGQYEQAVAAGESEVATLQEWSVRARSRVEELQAELARVRELEAEMAERARQMYDQYSDFNTAKEAARAKLFAARTAGVGGEVLDALRDALTYMDLVIESAATDGLGDDLFG